MNKTMAIGLSVLLCLYLAFGLMGCAQAQTQYKWALFIASTKNYEYIEMFTSYQQCKDTGEQSAAHSSAKGPLYECRLVVKDH